MRLEYQLEGIERECTVSGKLEECLRVRSRGFVTRLGWLAVKKNGWLSDLELETIRRYIEIQDNVVNNLEIREETSHHETNSIVEEAYIQQLRGNRGRDC